MKGHSNQPKVKLEHWQIISLYLMIYDIVAIGAAYFGALWIRYDCQFREIPRNNISIYRKSILFYIILCVVVFYCLKLYQSIWRFASYSELGRCICATGITFVAHIVVMTLLKLTMPVSYYVFGIVIQFCAVVAVRFSYRFVLLLRGRSNENSKKPVNVMIVGAGQTGNVISREVKGAKELNEKVVCFIDDNKNKWGRTIDGATVVGGRESIVDAVEKYNVDKIYIAMPSAKPADKRAILEICNKTSCELMSLPGVYQLSSGEVSVARMKPVAVEDLLGRDPIQPDMTEVFRFLEGKKVLVTGGGGSIGSELCRQIAAHRPKQLVIFDIYENNAYDIQQELRKKYPELNLEVIIGSVRDSRKVFRLFETYRPEIVYHAAAHKHVPLMEDSPCESIKNNAIGTYKTAFAAMTHGCKRFVLISTDKAVNPTNIMGASKRLCEMIIQAFDAKIKEGKAAEIPQLFTHSMSDLTHNESIEQALNETKTEFVAVRFGNVLGSNGSVIPLFKKQIEAGGPVTVTHPEIIRYFMTIPEAVRLVLLAGTYADGGEIFVLDMGEPVKIDTLARNLIRLSGHKPDEDIMVEYSGLRKGEKLFEEKLMAEEGLKKTPNKLIHIGCPIPFDIENFLVQLDSLMDSAYKNKDDIRERVKGIVTTYKPM